MTQNVVQNNELAKAFVESALHVKMCEPFIGLVIFEDYAPCAAFIFNNYDHHNVDMTICVKKVLKTRSIRDIARYVFENLQVERVTCVTRVSNSPAIKALERLNFVWEGVLRNRFTDQDGLIFSLLRSEQRFIKLQPEVYDGQHSLTAQSLYNSGRAN